MEKLFERALRKKFRFQFKGQCNVESLWDLRIEDLDKIYAALKREQQEETEVSLLKESRGSLDLKHKIEIVTYIVKTKMEEADAAKRRADTNVEKQKLMSLIADKENEALKSKSIEELKAELDKLS